MFFAPCNRPFRSSLATNSKSVQGSRHYFQVKASRQVEEVNMVQNLLAKADSTQSWMLSAVLVGAAYVLPEVCT